MSTANGRTSDCETISSVEINTAANCFTNEGFDSGESAVSSVTVKSPLDNTFVVVNRNVLPKSDFFEEVRAKLDAKHYFQKMVVQLDVSTLPLSEIVSDLLTAVSTFGPTSVSTWPLFRCSIRAKKWKK